MWNPKAKKILRWGTQKNSLAGRLFSSAGQSLQGMGEATG
jgi:hypothetical protein